MKSPAYFGLTLEQSNRIRSALEESLANGPKAEIDSENVLKRNDELIVSVHTEDYPTSMFAFFEALATAEINLCDSGLKVRLIPDVRQRMIVVATVAGIPVAYCSSDGSEYADLAKIVGRDEYSLSETGIVGFAYDSEDDFRIALEEAKSEFPSADFSNMHFA